MCCRNDSLHRNYQWIYEHVMFQDTNLTCTRIMFNLFKYTFSLSITSGSDEVLMIRPTMYFFMPENKMHDLVMMGLIFSQLYWHVYHISRMQACNFTHNTGHNHSCLQCSL